MFVLAAVQQNYFHVVYVVIKVNVTAKKTRMYYENTNTPRDVSHWDE